MNRLYLDNKPPQTLTDLYPTPSDREPFYCRCRQAASADYSPAAWLRCSRDVDERSLPIGSDSTEHNYLITSQTTQICTSETPFTTVLTTCQDRIQLKI